VLFNKRRDQLLDLVRQRGFASLPELKEELGVSESTIRRDLGHLEDAGTAKRTHGGVFYTGPAAKFPPFEERTPAHWDKKRAIAKIASEMVEDGDTVLLDGGSTTYEVARFLVGRPLQIVTNSLPVANLFASAVNTDLILIGGFVYPRSGVALGPHANEMLSRLAVRRTILSVAGINERGFFNSNVLLVETERAMMRAAEQVVIVADSSKFGRQGLAHLCPLAEAHVLIADDDLSPEWQDKSKQAGHKLCIASTAEIPTGKQNTSGENPS
jgi:DeoR/GlpR family transcriptional regulator of sugar metabolism